MVREADVACGTRIDVTRHTRPRDRARRPTRRAGGAQVAHRWRGHVTGATRVDADARVAPRGRGVAGEGPTG